jgi:excisionase family DNA binding protein
MQCVNNALGKEKSLVEAASRSYSYPMTLAPAALFSKTMSSLSRSVRARFLPTKDAAAILGVSVWTLRSYVHDGRLSYIPGGKWRFDREELDRFIVESKEKEQVL